MNSYLTILGLVFAGGCASQAGGQTGQPGPSEDSAPTDSVSPPPKPSDQPPKQACQWVAVGGGARFITEAGSVAKTCHFRSMNEPEVVDFHYKSGGEKECTDEHFFANSHGPKNVITRTLQPKEVILKCGKGITAGAEFACDCSLDN